MKNFVIRTAISLFFIGLLFYLIRGDLPLIVSALKNINKPILLLAVSIFLCTVIALGRRLQVIFHAQELKMKLTECCSLTFVGYFFNNFLPTSVGGDVVKALSAARVTKSKVKCITSVLMDRIFGLFTFVLIPSVSFLFIMRQIENRYVPLLIYSFLAFACLFFLILFNRDVARVFSFGERLLHRIRLAEKTRKIYDGLHNFKNHKGVMLQAVLLSFVGQSVSILVLYLMALALGATPNLIYFFILVPVVHLISMLPSLNGLGIRESAYTYFLAPYIGKEYAAAIGILWLGLLLTMSLVGAIIYLVRHDYHIHVKEPVKIL